LGYASRTAIIRCRQRDRIISGRGELVNWIRFRGSVGRAGIRISKIPEIRECVDG